MKKNYNKPNFEVNCFEVADIIASSGMTANITGGKVSFHESWSLSSVSLNIAERTAKYPE